MKKILAVFFAAVCLTASSFAFDFEAGVKGDLGKNLADGETVAGTLQNLDTTGNFEFGGSAYVHASIFPFLGVQIEPTIFKGTVKINGATELNGETIETTSTYDALTLDIPVMYWSSLKIWKLAIGAGVGVNLSKDYNTDKNIVANLEDAYGSAKTSLSDFALGIIAGADAKFYVTDHIGVVGSLRYVMDLTKKTVPIVLEPVEGVEIDTGKSYDTIDIARRFLYGSVGVEFKLF